MTPKRGVSAFEIAVDGLQVYRGQLARSAVGQPVIFTDDAKVVAREAGRVLYSGRQEQSVLLINERQVTILETEHFGKLAYVEVGATCVGKIQQTHHEDSFERGDEKGMFLFGGSTVIVLGEPGRWAVDDRLLDHTKEGVEAYLKMGQSLGRAL